MKRKFLLASMLLLTAGILAGCARSDTAQTSAGSGAGTQTGGSGQISGGGAGVEAVAGGAAIQGSGSAGSGSASGTSAADSGSAGTSGSASAGETSSAAGTGTDASASNEGGADAGATYDVANQSGEENTAASDWDGTYENADLGTLTLTQQDEHTLSFSFSSSGISGSAEIQEDGSAVYFGDDNHEVTFLRSGNSVSVTVMDVENNVQETDSPMNGTFSK